MKKIGSVLLALLTMLSLGVLGVSAEEVAGEVPMLSVGEPLRESWSADEEMTMLELAVEETGLYQFTITDHNQGGFVVYTVADYETESLTLLEICASIDEETGEIQAVNPWVSASTMLVEGHTYVMVCAYTDEESTYLAGDISIVLNKSEQSLSELPNCPIVESDLTATFDLNGKWFSFKTDEAGDYDLYYAPQDTDLAVIVYNAETGEEVATAMTQEYDDLTDEWVFHDKLTFPLQADTQYYFCIGSYEEGVACKLSMTRNEKTVSNIIVNNPLESFTSFVNVEKIDYTCFDYRIIYSDDTWEVVDSYRDLQKRGYTIPEVTYVGETIEIPYRTIPGAGKQPIQSTYNDISTIVYVNVESLVEYVSDLQSADDGDVCFLPYDNGKETGYCWHVCVSKSGMYDFYATDIDYKRIDFSDMLDPCYVTFFDEKNRPVPFDEETETWALIAGKDYALNIRYRYKEELPFEVGFCLDHVSNDLFGYDGWRLEGGKWYYYDNGKLLKNQWKQDSDGWCYLGYNGAMETDWMIDDSVGTCYVDDSGHMVTDQWVEYYGEWYYFDADGYMVKNAWRQDRNGWCYLGEYGAMMVNTWVKDSVGWCYVGDSGYIVKSNWVKDGGKWYYLDANGYMLSSTWQQDSKGWCYLGADGAMKTNSWIKDSVGWCYVGADGYCVTNQWKKDSVGWVYLDHNGRMLTNSWVQDSVGWCYVGADGYAVTKTWKKDSVGWCYLDENGSMTKNDWVEDGGKWYYLDGNGYMVTGTRSIGGKTYTFNASGVLVK